MNKEMIGFYQTKLARKENLLNKLQQKENDLDYEMTQAETIKLLVLQAEVRLLTEMVEDLTAC
jgi:hypothetical protein